ncbi:MAG: lipase chaperone LimK [Oleispira sp.]|jgi:lipase chaperone LimK
MMNTSLLTKISPVSIAITLAVIASLCLVFFSAGNDKDIVKIHTVDDDSTNTLTTKIATNKKTVATQWQWEEQPNTPIKKPTAAFTEASVYRALKSVRLDNQNNVIVDHEALIALNAALDDSRLQLDEQALGELQMIIKQGLPGTAGDDVAKIVTDYYNYLKASKEFNAIYEADSSNPDFPHSEAIEISTEEYKENYRELMSLRELYLGSETASKLFSTSDANANYMFDMLKIEQDTDLSDQEKKIRRKEIMETHAEQTVDVRNWNKRHSDFLTAKQTILNASISEQQKQAQLTELMHQRFNLEELAKIRHLQLDQP